MTADGPISVCWHRYKLSRTNAGHRIYSNNSRALITWAIMSGFLLVGATFFVSPLEIFLPFFYVTCFKIKNEEEEEKKIPK